MADPIKTQVLKTVETLLKEITAFTTVQREMTLPLELGDGPECYLWDENERPGVDFYRLARNEMDLWVTVFAKKDPTFQAFRDAAENWAALIHNKIFSIAGQALLRAAGVLLVEKDFVRKAEASETHGELVIALRLTFIHNIQDAYSKN